MTGRRLTSDEDSAMSRDRAAESDQRLPKHIRVKEQLREQIADLPAGTALKPERVLSEEFAASRATVRNALMELAVEGRIVRLQGRGTFVAPPKVTLPLRLVSYTQDMRERGTNPGSRLLETRREPADAEVAARLGLEPGTPTLRFERLRLADGTPMAVEVVHLQAERFAALETLMADDVSLYALLIEHWGLSPVSAEETIETVMSSPPTSGLLETEVGMPMLLLTRTTSGDDGEPFEFVRSIYRGDRYRFVSRLERPGG
jgi:GntR family transcriptional regulator